MIDVFIISGIGCIVGAGAILAGISYGLWWRLFRADDGIDTRGRKDGMWER